MLMFRNWLAMLLSSMAIVAASSVDDLVSRDGMIYADDQVIDQLFREPRDYTMILFLTTENPSLGCTFCNVLGPDLRVVANSWHKKHPNGDGLYFVHADYEECKRTFQRLGLQSVPLLKVYPPTDKPQGINSEHKNAEFRVGGSQIPPLIDLISQQGFRVELVRPIPWAKISKTLGTLLAAASAMYMFWGVVKAIVTSRQLWLVLALIVVLLCTSGLMYNQIRGTALLGQEHGQLVYFQRGFNGQLGIETQIVAAMYAGLSFVTICLIAKAPAISSPPLQTFMVLALAATVYVGYGYYAAVYCLKYSGYPYTLIPVRL